MLGSGTISPFNSQNTLFTRAVFPLLYLPTYVTFRFTDKLAPGTYKIKGLWGGNNAGEFTITVK